jgi:tetratricopeptide (TPR) repeat protein
MPHKVVVLLLLAVGMVLPLALSAAVVQAAPPGNGRAEPDHLQRGLAIFEQGFFELLPAKRKVEAEQAFNAATRELKLAEEEDPDSTAVHRALARVYAVRRDHGEAAAHYRRLTELDPLDIDAYILAAVSLSEMGRFAEARGELDRARGVTDDSGALDALEALCRRLARAETQAGEEKGGRHE